MKELITINNKQIQIKEYKGQRVVTFKDIDVVHERIEGTAGRNFRNNKKEFIENVDYFSVKGEELKSFKQAVNFVGSNTKEIILITASGYLMLVKSLNDDLAWRIQRELVNNYFAIQKVKREYHKPIDRAIKQHFNIAEAFIQATGIKPELAFAVAVNEAEKETGYSYDEYKKLLPSAQHDVASFNPTQIGERLGNIKPKQINKILEKLGMQEKKGDKWRITQQGKEYGEEKPFCRHGHSGYRISWHEKIIEVLKGEVCKS